jgi:putative FmdB family regulatory protein
MPLYEYQCDACGHRFEVIQKYSDAPIDICPKCGSAVHKLLSSPAIQFKGSGWYITDYAKKSGVGGKSEGSSSGSEGSKSGKSDGASTEGSSASGGAPAKTNTDSGGAKSGSSSGAGDSGGKS